MEDYNFYKARLSRLGFAPHGKSADVWCFANYSRLGCFDVTIYLDNNDNPFEFRVIFCCGKSEDCDETFPTFLEMRDKIRSIKKINRG